jgi:putative transposase
MARANRHYLPDRVWHLTHRCHQRAFLLKLVKNKQRWLAWFNWFAWSDLVLVRP